MAPAETRWVSASELAEYAYCPRAHFYRGRVPDSALSHSAVRSLDRGRAWHARELSVERHATGWGRLLLVLGALLLVTVGAVAWFLFR